MGIYLRHPRQARTQLFQEKVTLGELAGIFERPLLQAGFGYECEPGAPADADGAGDGGVA